VDPHQGTPATAGSAARVTAALFSRLRPDRAFDALTKRACGAPAGVFATPDGKVPTLDINGMALAMHGGADLSPASMRIAMQNEQYGVEEVREKNLELVARRDTELALLRRHLGRMPVGTLLA
jgi:hypothetical protein